jgi:hypothetical protein
VGPPRLAELIGILYLISRKRQNRLLSARFGLRRTGRRALRIAASALIICWAATACAQTRSAHQRKRPEVVKPVVLPANLEIPHYAPGRIPFADGETLTYEASWMKIPAAQARVRIHHDHKDPALWSGEMWITSSKPVDLIYRMRDYVREKFIRQSLQPQSMYIVQHEKHRFDVWHVNFDQDGHVVTSTERDTRGRIKTRDFVGGDPWGPFSGALMALSQPLKVGDKLTFDVFSGGNRYVFAFAVEAREQITTALGTFDTFRIEPSVVWLSNGKFRKEAKQTTIWVTVRDHVPVRIDSQVIFGYVQADLIDVSGGPAPGRESSPVEVSADKGTAADPPPQVTNVSR